MRLTLPYPPSMNSYWRSISKGRLSGRVLISEAGRQYRKLVSHQIGADRQRLALSDRLKVSVLANPPDRRRRDLDNLLKPLLDTLQHAGVYLDDTQIDDLRITRGDVLPGGRVVVEIESAAGMDWREALGDV